MKQEVQPLESVSYNYLNQIISGDKNQIISEAPRIYIYRQNQRKVPIWSYTPVI